MIISDLGREQSSSCQLIVLDELQRGMLVARCVAVCRTSQLEVAGRCSSVGLSLNRGDGLSQIELSRVDSFPGQHTIFTATSLERLFFSKDSCQDFEQGCCTSTPHPIAMTSGERLRHISKVNRVGTSSVSAVDLLRPSYSMLQHQKRELNIDPRVLSIVRHNSFWQHSVHGFVKYSVSQTD